MENPKVDFAIGGDLYGISIHELEERISILEDEIARVKGELARKKHDISAAEGLFGGKG